MKILILYDGSNTHINTVREYLLCFKKYMNAEVCYVPAANDFVSRNTEDLSSFDAIIFHYSIRLAVDWHISSSWLQQIYLYQGVKALFVQDEYEVTDMLRTWLVRLKFDLVFTCVPKDQIELVYAKARYPNTEFINVLTGYAPENDKDYRPYILPNQQRKNTIGYRGRKLPFWLGDLAHEKMDIGITLKKWCQENNITCDIEWSPEHRIYGNAWYKFLGSSLATLGTESGSNIFDDTGDLQKNITNDLKLYPQKSYSKIKAQYLKGLENRVTMNQISPKIFESICLRTALILFEGKCSGILEPGKHFFELKKDYSNLSDLKDFFFEKDNIKKMVDLAYQDIIESGRFSYKVFCELVEGKICEKVSTNHRKKSTEHFSKVKGAGNPAYSYISNDLFYFEKDPEILTRIRRTRRFRNLQFIFRPLDFLLSQLSFNFSKGRFLLCIGPIFKSEFFELTFSNLEIQNETHALLKFIPSRNPALIAFPREKKKFLFDTAGQWSPLILIKFSHSIRGGKMISCKFYDLLTQDRFYWKLGKKTLDMWLRLKKIFRIVDLA